MRRWGAVVATPLLLVLLGAGLAACSDDGGGDGGGDEAADASDDSDATAEPSEQEAFCAAAEPEQRVVAGQVAGPTEMEVAEVRALAEVAPEELVDDLEAGADVLEENIAIFEELAEDPLDGEGFDAGATAAAERAETALAEVATYLAEECGFDVEPGIAEEGEGASTESGVQPEAARAYLAETAPDLADKVTGLQVNNSTSTGDTLHATIEADDVALAGAVCEALSGYVYDEVGAQFVEIYVEGPYPTSADRLNETADCSGFP